MLPSHGRPFRGLHRRIANVRAHHHQQLDTLRAACAEPKSAFELVPVMFGRTLRGFHRFLALGETLAHLTLPLARWRDDAHRGRRGRASLPDETGSEHEHFAFDGLVGAGGSLGRHRTRDGHFLPADAGARLRGGRDRGAPRLRDDRADRRGGDRRQRRDRPVALAPARGSPPRSKRPQPRRQPRRRRIRAGDEWSAERTARVQYRGSLWTARLAPGEAAAAGSHVVRAVESNSLVLAPAVRR